MNIKTAGEALLNKRVSFKTHLSEGIGMVEGRANTNRGEYVLVRVDGRDGKRNAILACRPSQCIVVPQQGEQ